MITRNILQKIILRKYLYLFHKRLLTYAFVYAYKLIVFLNHEFQNIFKNHLEYAIQIFRCKRLRSISFRIYNIN